MSSATGRLRSLAKINLDLRVLDKRTYGYDNLPSQPFILWIAIVLAALVHSPPALR